LPKKDYKKLHNKKKIKLKELQVKKIKINTSSVARRYARRALKKASYK